MPPKTCDHCDTPSTALRPIVDSISQTYLCPACYDAHIMKYGAEPTSDPFARMQAYDRLR